MADAQNLLRIGEPHIGEVYVFGARVAKDNPDHHGPWDCAEFVSWCVYQQCGRLYGCDNNNSDPSCADAYTGYWERDARSVLKMISVKESTGIQGAILLRYPTSRNGHIALSDGRGGTIEAMGRRFGVTRGSVSGRIWHTGVLLPELDYETSTEPTIEYREPEGILCIGANASREDIMVLQRQLGRLGYAPGSMDGIYGRKTAIAVHNFQLEQGLVADGEVGSQTRKALQDALNARTVADEINAEAAPGEFTIDTNLKKTSSPLTADRIDSFFSHQQPGKQGLEGIGAAVMEASRKNIVNATYIVAHAILETGWGESLLCKEKNNLFGWGAEDGDPYGGAKRFDSREECIAYVVSRVDQLYLRPTGRYFQTSPCLGNKRYGMNVNYASDQAWGSKIASIGRKVEREA